MGKAAESENKTVLGDRLREFRRALKLSQAQLAEKVGARMRTIQDNEAGKTFPSSKIFLGLVDLGLNANWFFTGEGPMRRDSPEGSQRKEVIDQFLIMTICQQMREIEDAHPERARMTSQQFVESMVHLCETFKGERRAGDAALQRVFNIALGASKKESEGS